jgi:arylsulfatase A-like enzyme
LLELLQLSVRNQLSGSVWLGILRMNRHFGWMIPVADAVIFLAAGLALGILARFAPALARWLVMRLPGFLAALALLLTIRGLHLIACLSLAAALAHLIGKNAFANERMLLAAMRLSLPVIVLIELGLAGASIAPLVSMEHPEGAPAGVSHGQGRPSVLLIVLDTARAESLSLQGYVRETTPNLARLAQRGIRFEQARSTAPWTFPSHASIFTGRWPHELKVGENRPLDSRYPTLAECLSARGYRTGGFVANTFFCNSWYGLARGFDRYEDFYDDDVAISWSEAIRCTTLGQRLLTTLGASMADHRIRKDAARINQDFLEWHTEGDGRPFFAFLNYFDPHSPYLLPRGERRRLGTREPGDEERTFLQTWDDRPRPNASLEQIQLVRDAYDECIAYLDEQLGQLFDELERRGALANTLVIITSDHGEELGEHGLFGHGKSLYGQETHVPLVIVPPSGNSSESMRGIVIPEPVSLRDLPATVLDFLDTGDSSPFPGTSLVPYKNRRSPTSPARTSPAFSEVALRLTVSPNLARPPAWRGPMHSVAAGDRSYIRNADGKEELHDLRTDPPQQHNLAGLPGERPTLESLRALVQSVLDAN